MQFNTNVIPVAGQVRMEPIFWRLLYGDGSTLDEPAEGGTIINAWANAVALCIVHVTGQVVWTISLEGGYRPIWYREFSAVVEIGRSVNKRGTRLDATVFGKAKETTNAIHLGKKSHRIDKDRDVSIWALLHGQNEIINCPQKYVRLNVIEQQLTCEVKTKIAVFNMKGVI